MHRWKITSIAGGRRFGHPNLRPSELPHRGEGLELRSKGAVLWVLSGIGLGEDPRRPTRSFPCLPPNIDERFVTLLRPWGSIVNKSAMK